MEEQEYIEMVNKREDMTNAAKTFTLLTFPGRKHWELSRTKVKAKQKCQQNRLLTLWVLEYGRMVYKALCGGNDDKEREQAKMLSRHQIEMERPWWYLKVKDNSGLDKKEWLEEAQKKTSTGDGKLEFEPLPFCSPFCDLVSKKGGRELSKCFQRRIRLTHELSVFSSVTELRYKIFISDLAARARNADGQNSHSYTDVGSAATSQRHQLRMRWPLQAKGRNTPPVPPFHGNHAQESVEKKWELRNARKLAVAEAWIIRNRNRNKQLHIHNMRRQQLALDSILESPLEDIQGPKSPDPDREVKDPRSCGNEHPRVSEESSEGSSRPLSGFSNLSGIPALDSQNRDPNAAPNPGGKGESSGPNRTFENGQKLKGGVCPGCPNTYTHESWLDDGQSGGRAYSTKKGESKCDWCARVRGTLPPQK
jgi:hypothetical protein